jgi:hypothetical protein
MTAPKAEYIAAADLLMPDDQRMHLQRGSSDDIRAALAALSFCRLARDLNDADAYIHGCWR